MMILQSIAERIHYRDVAATILRKVRIGEMSGLLAKLLGDIFAFTDDVSQAEVRLFSHCILMNLKLLLLLLLVFQTSVVASCNV